MFYHRFSSCTRRAGVALLLFLFTAACGPAAPRDAGPGIETSRAVETPAEKAVVREVIREVAAPVAKETLREAVAEAVAAQLQQLTQPGVAVWSAAVTPGGNAGDVVWTRVSGETAVGTISGETGDTAFRLLKIQLTAASKDLTVTTPGLAAAFAGQTLRIGDNFLSFQSNADRATYNSNSKQTVWSFVGDYADWYKSSVTYPVAVLTPINPANLLPAPIPAATAIPNHLLGYDDEVNQVPLSLLDDRYRRQVPADTPKVFSFPTDPAPAAGDRVILLHPDAVLQYYTGTIIQAQVTLRTMAVNLTIPGGNIVRLQGYSPTYTGPDAAALRGKVFAIVSGSPTSRPTWLYYKGIPHSISQSLVPGARYHYEVSGLGYAQLVVDEKPQYAFTLADGARYPHDRQYQPDTYTFNGSSWERTPGSVSRWAESDSMDKIPPSKLPAAATQSLHAGPGNGLTINSSGQAARRSSLTQFSPAFNLANSDKDLGIITVQAKLRLVRRFPSTIGFDQEAPARRGITLEGMAFASAVKADAAYSATADNGEKIGEAVIYNGATTLGTVSLYVARDANNALGYYLSYAGKSGSLTFAVELSDLEVGFIPNDKPPKDKLRGRLLTTATLPAAGGTPTSNARLHVSWQTGSDTTGEASVSNFSTVLNSWRPPPNCIGLLAEATINGVTSPRRSILILGPGNLDLNEGNIVGSDSDVGVSVMPLAATGASVLLVWGYHPMYGVSLKIHGNKIGRNPDRFDSYPANVVIRFYEAVIGPE